MHHQVELGLILHCLLARCDAVDALREGKFSSGLDIWSQSSSGFLAQVRKKTASYGLGVWSLTPRAACSWFYVWGHLVRVESSGHATIQFYEDRRGSLSLGTPIDMQREVVVMMIKLKLMQCLLHEWKLTIGFDVESLCLQEITRTTRWRMKERVPVASI